MTESHLQSKWSPTSFPQSSYSVVFDEAQGQLNPPNQPEARVQIPGQSMWDL